MTKVLDTQVGGSHYKTMAYQPVVFFKDVRLGFTQGSIIKYVSRYKLKNGIEDIKKAKHLAELAIEINEVVHKDHPDYTYKQSRKFINDNKFDSWQEDVIVNAVMGRWGNIKSLCSDMIKILEKHNHMVGKGLVISKKKALINGIYNDGEMIDGLINVLIPDFGFNPEDFIKKDSTLCLSFKSGEFSGLDLAIFKISETLQVGNRKFFKYSLGIEGDDGGLVKNPELDTGMPYSSLKVKIGDQFVFHGIDLKISYQ